MKNEIKNKDFYTDIKNILYQARNNVFKSANFFMVEAYWNIGKRIIEEEQKGEKRAEYGTVVKYSILKENKQIFASKYQLYLPSEQELSINEVAKGFENLNGVE